MSYRVLARTWRPQRFEDLLGQEPVVTTLTNALTAGSFGHAYLFSGLRGVGKTTAARLLAMALNCESGPTAQPCGSCLSCREIGEGRSMDVVEIDGASNRGIDDVRELRELLRYRPTRDRYRVIIIDEVHMLTGEAFNALLKSLEEPPPHIVFVFATTERHKVPATILSRCQQLEFRPVGVSVITNHLMVVAEREGFELQPEAAGMIARAADGSVRDALSLTDQLRSFSGDAIDVEAVATVVGVPPAERLVELIEAFVRGDAGAALTAVRDDLLAGHDPSVLYRELGRGLRAAALAAGDVPPEAGESIEPRLRDLAGELELNGWTRLLGVWLEHEGLLRGTVNRELALEVAVLRLCRWPAVQRVEGMLAGGAEPPGSSAGGSSRRAGGGDTAGKTSAAGQGLGERLAQHLWDADRRVLAGAIEAADVRRRESRLLVRFEGEYGALAELVRSEAGTVTKAAADVLGRELDLAVETVPDRNGVIRAEAEADPGVVAALGILGGEIASVTADGADPEGWDS